MAPYIYKSIASIFGLVHASSEVADANGWGNYITWLSLEEGQRIAEEEGKPLMVVVHTKSCPYCVRLKSRFSRSNLISGFSQSFVMVNLDRKYDDMSSTLDLTPDGKYVPRIMFYMPNGKLIREACNLGTDRKFNYDSDVAVANMMKHVRKRFN